MGRTSFRFLGLILFGLVFTMAGLAHDHTLPSGFILEEIYLEGLELPTDIDFAQDGRMFICEQTGAIRIVENGQLLDAPLYTVHTQTPNERGLAGLILDPNFEQNGYIYMYYTLPYENKNIVSRITVIGNGVLPNSELEIFRGSELYGSWHNGGAMAFDDTGKLLIACGDGTSHPNAMELDSKLGKMIRINVDGTIPADNPFVGVAAGEYEAIAAVGLRNPYTMARSRLTGQIFINDVGNALYEEVNEYIPGANYGWPDLEGYRNGAPAPGNNYEDPLFAYDHEGAPCAIVGAAFYEPEVNRFPADYFGQYFFLDLCSFDLVVMDPGTSANEKFGTGLPHAYNNLAVSPDGDIYLISITDGLVSRITYQGEDSSPIISQPLKDQVIALGEDAQFTVEAAGVDLGYDWYWKGNRVQSGEQNTLVLPGPDLSADGSSVWVTIRNENGQVRSETVTLTVIDGTRPSIQFQNMPWSYAAGDTIHYEAVASDPDQYGLPSSAYAWKIDFHHNTHSHPVMPYTSGSSFGEYVMDTYGEVATDVFLRFTLTVTDSSGLTATRFTDIPPELVRMYIRSIPPGLQLNIDGSDFVTDGDLVSTKNLNRTFQIPNAAVVGDSIYQFLSFDDGDNSLVRVLPAVADTVTLIYEAHEPYFHATEAVGFRTVFLDTASQREYYKTEIVDRISDNWDLLSPYPNDRPEIPEDYFGARWEGYVVPPVTGNYTFYMLHDGRASLEVDGRAVIQDRVAAYGMSEDTATIALRRGDSVKVVLDYDHFDYLARVELNWQFSLLERQPVRFGSPVRVPDPGEEFASEDRVLLFPNPAMYGQSNVFVPSNIHPGDTPQIRIRSVQGQLLHTLEPNFRVPVYSLQTTGLRPGVYLIEIQFTGQEFVQKLVVQ